LLGSFFYPGKFCIILTKHWSGHFGGYFSRTHVVTLLNIIGPDLSRFVNEIFFWIPRKQVSLRTYYMVAWSSCIACHLRNWPYGSWDRIPPGGRLKKDLILVFLLPNLPKSFSTWKLAMRCGKCDFLLLCQVQPTAQQVVLLVALAPRSEVI
jgi:hypothetical protein